MEHFLLVRYGEIGLKGRNRPFFLEALTRNLAAQAGRALEIRSHFGRVLIRLVDAPEDHEIIARVRRTFGVVSVSPAVRIAPRLEGIIDAATTLLARTLERRRVVSFKVDTRRADKRFPLSSVEVNTAVGRHLQDRFGLRVDLEDPDVTVSVEIRDRAYLYTEVLPGPGGLPAGTGGRVVALLSGGIDSPVAAWMVARRGLTVIPVHYYAFPFVNERSKVKVIDLCRVLAGYAGPLRLWVAYFTEIQRAVQTSVEADLRVTVLRRMMMRLAERIAEREGALGLVTGESAGQVASQTLASIAAIDAATTLPVLRPVIGMDKTEITARAREIGTYETSILPYEDCCSLFVPEHPRTQPTVAEVEAQERGLAVEQLAAEALRQSEVIEISPREAPELLVGATP